MIHFMCNVSWWLHVPFPLVLQSGWNLMNPRFVMAPVPKLSHLGRCVRLLVLLNGDHLPLQRSNAQVVPREQNLQGPHIELLLSAQFYQLLLNLGEIQHAYTWETSMGQWGLTHSRTLVHHFQSGNWGLAWRILETSLHQAAEFENSSTRPHSDPNPRSSPRFLPCDLSSHHWVLGNHNVTIVRHLWVQQPQATS